MSLFDHHDDEIRELREENRILRIELKLAHHELQLQHHETRRLLDIIDRLLPSADKRLTNIKLTFGGIMANTVTINVGQTTKATVLGFDQNNQPWAGEIPAVTYTADQTSVVNVNPDGANGADVSGAAAGNAVVTASLTTVEGVALTGQGSVTVNDVTPPTPVLSSIVVDFSQPV